MIYFTNSFTGKLCRKFVHHSKDDSTSRFYTIFIARCYAERGYATVSRLTARPFVCLFVTSGRPYVFHTGWNTSKIISRPIILRHLLTSTPWAIWCNGNTPKLRVE